MRKAKCREARDAPSSTRSASRVTVKWFWTKVSQDPASLLTHVFPSGVPWTSGLPPEGKFEIFSQTAQSESIVCETPTALAGGLFCPDDPDVSEATWTRELGNLDRRH